MVGTLSAEQIVGASSAHMGSKVQRASAPRRLGSCFRRARSSVRTRLCGMVILCASVKEKKTRSVVARWVGVTLRPPVACHGRS